MMKAKEINSEEELASSQLSILSVLREKAHLFPSKRLYTFLSPNKTPLLGKTSEFYFKLRLFNTSHNDYEGSFQEMSSLTYSEFYHQSATLAKALLRHVSSSDKAKERILLVYPPSLDFIVAFFGCLFAGLSMYLLFIGFISYLLQAIYQILYQV